MPCYTNGTSGCSGSGDCFFPLVNVTTLNPSDGTTTVTMQPDTVGYCICHSGYSGNDMIRSYDDCQVVEITFDALALITATIFLLVLIRSLMALRKSRPWSGNYTNVKDLFARTKLIFYILQTVSAMSVIALSILLYLRQQYSLIARFVHVFGFATHFPLYVLLLQMFLMTIPRGHLEPGSALKRMNVGIGTTTHSYVVAIFCFLELFCAGVISFVKEDLSQLAFDFTMVSAAVWTAIIGPFMLWINSRLVSHLGDLMRASAVSAKTLAGPRSKMVKIFWLNVIAIVFCIFCFLAGVVWPLASARIYAVYLPVTAVGGLIVLASTFVFTFSGSNRENHREKAREEQRRGEVAMTLQRRATIMGGSSLAAGDKYTLGRTPTHRKMSSGSFLSDSGSGTIRGRLNKMGSFDSPAGALRGLNTADQGERMRDRLLSSEDGSFRRLPTSPVVGSAWTTPKDASAGSGAVRSRPGHHVRSPSDTTHPPLTAANSFITPNRLKVKRCDDSDSEELADDEYIDDSDDMQEQSFSDSDSDSDSGTVRRAGPQPGKQQRGGSVRRKKEKEKDMSTFVRYTTSGRVVRTRNPGGIVNMPLPGGVTSKATKMLGYASAAKPNLTPPPQQQQQSTSPFYSSSSSSSSSSSQPAAIALAPPPAPLRAVQHERKASTEITTLPARSSSPQLSRAASSRGLVTRVKGGHNSPRVTPDELLPPARDSGAFSSNSASGSSKSRSNSTADH